MPQIIDADAHVVEGASFAQQALARWPQLVKYQAGKDGKGGFTMEGRRYPEPEGPGAGCPPQHGLTTAAGSDPYTIEGTLRDADRESIDRMVLYPSMGLAAPTLRDPRFAAEFSALYNGFIADWCKRSGGRLFGVAVVPIEDVPTSIRMLAEAKQQGLVCTLVPPALRERNLDHPGPRALLGRRRRSRHAARRARRARNSSAEDRRRPLHELHPGPLRELPVRSDDGDDVARLGRRLRPPSAPARRLPRGGRELGAVLHRPPARALGEARRLDPERLAARPARVRRARARSTSRASPTRRCCPRCSTRSARIS